MSATRPDSKIWSVLMYVPNVIGYFRILLVALAHHHYATPSLFVPLFVLAALLDIVDGVAARWLHQESKFGEFLDVMIDLFSRGVLWGRVSPEFGAIVSGVEWLTFLSASSEVSANWKQPAHPPWYIALIMKDNFKSPLGVLAMAGVWGLPVWLYCVNSQYISYDVTMVLCCASWLTESQVVYCITYTMLACRILAFTAEIWYISCHLSNLLHISLTTSKHSSPQKNKTQ